MAWKAAKLTIIIFTIVTFFYLALLLWFKRGIQDYLNTNKQPVEDRPFVSVIVAARNEEQNIEPLLHSLFQQTYPHHLYEVIIANDRSTDDTLNILKSAAKEYDHLEIVHIDETPNGWAPKKWALQSAIEASQGTILLFTDADCAPASTWIDSLTEKFYDESIGLVSGFAPLTGKHALLNELYLLDSISQDAFSAGGFSRHISLSCTGRNMGIRKSVFDEVDGYGGINRFISGDDDLMLQKIASLTEKKILFNFDAGGIVYSNGPETLKQFVFQKLRFASKGLSYYGLQTTGSLKLILPLLYIASISSVLALPLYVLTGSPVWIIPWLIKFTAELIYTRYIYKLINMQWNLFWFMIMSLVHPLYVVIFGTLGPFINIQWKNDDN